MNEDPLKVSLENIIPLTEARDHFSQIVNEVQKDKLYVLTKGGKPAVAIIDVKYLERITGGEIREENIEKEIAKAPEKVGLPPIVEHVTTMPPPPPPPKPIPASPIPPKPTPPPSPPPRPPVQDLPDNAESRQAGTGVAGGPNPTPPPVPKPEPKPNIPPPPPPRVAPATNAPSQPPQSTLKTPPEANKPSPDQNKITIQESSLDSETKPELDPEDKVGPAQYAGSADEEPEDMVID